VLPNATLGDGGVAPGIVKMDFQEKYADAATKSMIHEMGKVQAASVLPYPLVYLSAEDAEAISRLQGRIAPFAEKRMAEFVTGDTPLNPDTFREFSEELERLGLNDMIGIWQKYVK
jgi:hypothetical protein